MDMRNYKRSIHTYSSCDQVSSHSQLILPSNRLCSLCSTFSANTQEPTKSSLRHRIRSGRILVKGVLLHIGMIANQFEIPRLL